MGELLGIGMTHAPHLQFTDENMANVLRRLLKSERTPAAMKDPQNWPAGMRAEWGSDEGLTAARSIAPRSSKACAPRALRWMTSSRIAF